MHRLLLDDTLSTLTLFLLVLLLPLFSCSTGGQKPLSRVKYMREGTASRDNSELCLSSSRPALPSSRASAFVNLARDPGLVHSSTRPRFVPGARPRALNARGALCAPRRSTIRFGSIHRTKTVLNSPQGEDRYRNDDKHTGISVPRRVYPAHTLL